MKALVFIAITTAAAGAGCSKTDPGSGSKTLYALVEIEGHTDHTTVEAEISLRGNSVPGANVVVKDDETGTAYTLESNQGGIYKARLPGYVRTLELKVTSGDDELEAQLEGPAVHRITRPADDVRVRRGDFESLTVKWEAEDDADRVEVAPQGGEAISLAGDAYEVDVPLAQLENGDQRIGVLRETTVDLAGGTEGSLMRSRYKVDNRFTLE